MAQRVESMVRDNQAVIDVLEREGMTETEARRVAFHVRHALNYELLVARATRQQSALEQIAAMDANDRDFVRVARSALGL